MHYLNDLYNRTNQNFFVFCISIHNDGVQEIPRFNDTENIIIQLFYVEERGLKKIDLEAFW